MSRSRSRLATALVALAMLLLSACGSQLAPGDVIAAGGTTGATGEADDDIVDAEVVDETDADGSADGQDESK